MFSTAPFLRNPAQIDLMEPTAFLHRKRVRRAIISRVCLLGCLQLEAELAGRFDVAVALGAKLAAAETLLAAYTTDEDLAAEMDPNVALTAVVNRAEGC